MKKIVFLSAVFAVVFSVMLSGVTFAASIIYLPTNDSDEYLPTVKIFAYSLNYDGTLMGEAYGSGTLIDSSGIILTNNHVIENYYDPTAANDAFQICLTKSNDPEEPICEFTASLIARDPDRDLALLKMDTKDVSDNKVIFDFYLPYDNEGSYAIGDDVTVIGYPDTGGRTITYTSGLISGFLTESGIKYVKTDADISFGNSGGTAVDEDGNLIGVPTFIVGSYSSEVLGYLFPIGEAVDWINAHKSDSSVSNVAAEAALKEAMLANISANKTGVYKNTYPSYEISLVDGWKFGNNLEGSFEGGGYGSYYGSSDVIIYPVERSDTSQLYVEVSVTDYAYNVTLEDIEYLLDSYTDDYYYEAYSEEESTNVHERVDFNGYQAVKETYSYYDWWYSQDVLTVTYYIPYGDKVINVIYGYTTEDADKLSEVDEMLATFTVDMDKIVFSVVDVVESDDPKIKVNNPFDDIYLSDDTYEYDGVNYFGASFGKKMDYNFYINIYSNEYWDESYVDDFDAFKDATLADVESWYDIVSKGELKIDGHDGFFYTDEFDDGYGYISLYTTVYIESDENTYFSIYHSAKEESYKEHLDEFKLILKNIELSNKGKGIYIIPSFSVGLGVGKSLSDIKNHVYEDDIKNLNSYGAFGEDVPTIFNPEGALSRMDFVMWAVKSMQGSFYDEFKASYIGCGEDCFVDVDHDSDDAVYLEFAKSKGAIVSNKNFYPEAQISLMAALKIAFELNDYEVWQAPEWVAWYIPYLQLGYKRGVIPYGVDNAGYLLTRGEGAYIIDGIIYGSGFHDYY